MYASEATEEQRSTVATEIYSRIREFEDCYERTLDEEQHVRNIGDLADHVSGKCSNALNEGRLPFGIAQKFLNSYLKYLWCAGRIEMPPHCPFDGIVIGKLKLPPHCEWQWTKGSRADYSLWVAAARIAANPESLAQWELRVWSDQ